MLRRTFTLAAVVALAIWVVPAIAADDPKPGTHEGKVVKVDGNKLTMTDKDGKNEHTHAIPADAKITFDGKAIKLSDLKAGDKVKVTAEKKDDKVVIVSIEASKAD